MEEKLKSILKRTHWYLIAKVAALGLVWFFLPFPFFLILSLVFYFFPSFRPMRFLMPFLAIIFFASLSLWQGSFFMAVVFGLALYFLFGVKDLILIDRKTNFQLLTFLLVFLGALVLFFSFSNWLSFRFIFWSVILVAFCLTMLRVAVTEGRAPLHINVVAEEGRRRNFIVFGLAGFLLWQVIITLMILPITGTYKLLSLFLIFVIFLEMMSDFYNETISRNKILIELSIAAIFFVFIFSAASWGL